MDCKCPYCHHRYSDDSVSCPHCGTPNDRFRDEWPKTIHELRDYCSVHGIETERMRVYLGRKSSKAKAYGIYRNHNGDYAVYKNLDDETREISFTSADETEAVYVMYQKLGRILRGRHMHLPGAAVDHSASDREIRHVRHKHSVKTLKKTMTVVTAAAIVGVLVLVFFMLR